MTFLSYLEGLIQESNPRERERERERDLSGCGKIWLQIKKAKVVGMF